MSEVELKAMLGYIKEKYPKIYQKTKDVNCL